MSATTSVYTNPNCVCARHDFANPCLACYADNGPCTCAGCLGENGEAQRALAVVRERDQIRADLAACRARLAALVAACEPFEPQSDFPWPSVAPAYDAARDWLRAHPVEGGQDANA